MTSVRLEVQWSPVHSDRFITWGTEIFLYETLLKQENTRGSSYIDISETNVAHLLATSSNHYYVKCVDIYPRKEPEMLLAIGQANGKVILTTFSAVKLESLSGFNNLEFVPKHARQCNVVSWNKTDSQLLAAGLDRYRSDHCVLVWDILSGRQHATVAELGLSDTAHSLTWLYSQPKTLVIGMNNKHLRMVDLRDPSKAANSSQTKAVFGITVPSYESSLLASYVENQVVIWDIRAFDKPVYTVPQGKPVTKILWCPTRRSLLGSLQRESRSIHLHNVQQMDDMETSVLERSVKPGLQSQITSFSWHSEHENRLLAITLNGSIMDYTVFERMTLNWSSMSNVVWTCGQRTLKMVSDADDIYEQLGDISSAMKKRALRGYGLKGELRENALLVDDISMKEMWIWLDHSKALVEDGTLQTVFSNNHPGIRYILGMEASTSSTNITAKSELTLVPWTGVATSSSAKVYKSEVRDKALCLCNWRFIHDPVILNDTIGALERDGLVTKAAALAVFSQQLKQAIKLLYETEYNTVSMALSGYTDDKASVWREACIASRMKLEDPYLRAIFAFLTADSDNYDLVINEQGMSVIDRVGFALTFLSDTRLAEFINTLTDQLTQQGDLCGIILTGMSPEVIPLLQCYLDNTSDVQGVSVLAMRAFPPYLLEHEAAQYWINSYRELLDTWRLWTERAEFDVLHNKRAPSQPEQQVYVSCNFCGKSASALNHSRAKYSPFPRMSSSANQYKMSCCPNCRKPQPRCAICLVHMGTASCYLPSTPASSVLVNPFDSWYTWCQTCRHGGHAAHITSWFKEHQECPVTACNCRCLSLDTTSNIPSASSINNS